MPPAQCSLAATSRAFFAKATERTEEFCNARSACEGQLQSALETETKRVIQLRNRSVVACPTQTGRRNKAIKSADPASSAAKPEDPSSASDPLHEPAVGPSTGVAADKPEAASSAPVHEQNNQEGVGDDPDGAGPSATAGTKRGRKPARGAAAKRAKVPPKEDASEVGTVRAVTVIVPGEDAAAGSTYNTGGQLAVQISAADASPQTAVEDTIAEAECSNQEATEEDVQPATKPRVKSKKANKEPPASAAEELAQDPSQPGPSGPPAAEFTGRVTRSRRNQATMGPAPAPAQRPPRGKAAQQKRTVQEAALSSPGMHLKSKPATEDKVIMPQAPPPLLSPLRSSGGTAVAGASCMPELAPQGEGAARPPAAPECQEPHEGAAGTAAGAAAEPAYEANNDAEPAAAEPSAALLAGAEHGKEDRSVVEAQPTSHPVQEPAAGVATSLFSRMPTKIATTIALLGGAPASRGAECREAAGPVAAAVLEPASKMQDCDLQPFGSGKAAMSNVAIVEGVDEAQHAAASVAAVPQPERHKGSADGGGFCFGTRSPDQRSPDMPHFGSAAEQSPDRAPANVDVPLTASGREQQEAQPQPIDGPCTSKLQAAEDHSGAHYAEERDAGEQQTSAAARDRSPVFESRHRSLSLGIGLRLPSVVVMPSRAIAGSPGADVDDRPDEPASDEDDAPHADLQQPGPSGPATANNYVEEEEGGAADGSSGLEGTEPPSTSGQHNQQPDIPGSSHGTADGEQGANAGRECSLRCSRDAQEAAHGDEARSSSDAPPSPSSAAEAEATITAGAGASKNLDIAAEKCLAAADAQGPKPKGNLVSSIRSFLPARVVASPPPAAGKKPVKVKALEAAKAAKQKDAARLAERAQARAAAPEQRQRQGQTDAAATAAHASAAGPTQQATAGTRPNQGANERATTRAMPATSAAQASEAAAAPSASTAAAEGQQPARQAVTVQSTVNQEEQRDDGSSAMAISVKAKAAFFQAKEEQAKRAAADLTGARRVPVGPSASAVPQGGPAHKAGANARVGLAAGAIVQSEDGAAAAALPPAPRLANPVAPETAADKHKRVEAKRREEEERRRAELEARSKAKDDKLRNFEANRQQQRLAGAAAPPRPPTQPAINPLAVFPQGKRPPLNTGGIKPEPEAHRTGPLGPIPGHTPGPKPAHSSHALPSMHSPAVQMQIKLLPAVHAGGTATASLSKVAVSKAGPAAQGATAVVPPSQKQQPPAASGAAAAGAAVSSAAPAAARGSAGLTEEDKRNVRAIQTSPYVVKDKRTPGVNGAIKPVFTSYEISPYRSDADGSSDEDSPRRRKALPEWANSANVLASLQQQNPADADAIFGTCPPTIDVVAVFSDMPPPGKLDARGRVRRDYTRRGSSGCWDKDRLTEEECERYRELVQN